MINRTSANLRLPAAIPEGQLVDRKWLKKQGFGRPDIDYYLRSGALKAVARGVYLKPGSSLKWQSILYSLQEMGTDVHVGGPQAIAEQGLSHFVSMSGKLAVHLYSSSHLPGWLSLWGEANIAPATDQSFHLVVHHQAWLKKVPARFYTQKPFGSLDWGLHLAKPELAILQCLVELKTEVEFQQLDRWFEALGNLSPESLRTLLLLCPNVKAKRLFGWFAERHHHAWFKHIDWTAINLGSGKRSVVSGGSLSKRWQITVPKIMEVPDGSEQSIF